ncbi:TrkA family potassium uptake protein [Cryobacterium sp. GrIS_2_6]|uniref:potassium channel family protein n=1 Tax=Cryobacterium sp. GrIS_2_6 TaxID=3162785 RepID=UPI002E014526|nr:trk system potassium uptake protein TrkA [Cryobacterium psychrotolerans]
MAKFSLFGRRSSSRLTQEDAVVVIGLGRFGSSLALELMKSGTEVLGIDGDADIVQAHNGLLTHVVRADSTKEETLRQLAVADFSTAVVAIGGDIQANILTASLLLKLGIGNIWAKAVSEPHGAILDQLGVTHVIYPEKDMGKRVAHLVRGVMQDYLEIGDNFALVKMAPPRVIVGVPLGESRVRPVHGVTVTAFLHEGAGWSYTTLETVLEAGDVILVAGETERVEAFSRLR